MWSLRSLVAWCSYGVSQLGVAVWFTCFCFFFHATSGLSLFASIYVFVEVSSSLVIVSSMSSLLVGLFAFLGGWYIVVVVVSCSHKWCASNVGLIQHNIKRAMWIRFSIMSAWFSFYCHAQYIDTILLKVFDYTWYFLKGPWCRLGGWIGVSEN